MVTLDNDQGSRQLLDQVSSYQAVTWRKLDSRSMTRTSPVSASDTDIRQLTTVRYDMYESSFGIW